MCCNFCRFQLNAGAGSRAGSSLGRGPVRVQGLLWCVGELEQGLLGWAPAHSRSPPLSGCCLLAPGDAQSNGGGQQQCSGRERAGGCSWPSAACATLVRPRAAGVSQKEVPAPGPGFLQSRPAAPPPPDGPQLMFPGHRSRPIPLATVPQYPTATGPWLMALSQHSLAQCPLVGTAAPRWCVGSRRSGYQSNVFSYKEIYICKPS